MRDLNDYEHIEPENDQLEKNQKSKWAFLRKNVL